MALLLDDQIRRNRRKSWMILALVGLVLAAVLAASGYALGLPGPLTLVVALAASLFYLLLTVSSSTSTILTAAKARPANPADRLEKLLTYRVEELAIAAGLRPPKVYVQDSRDINAFAAGRRPDEAVVCVTRGALEQLNQAELEGVIAHEMSHIKNYDVRVATLTLAAVGMIGLLSEIILRIAFFSRRGGRGKGGGPLALVLVVVGIFVVVLAPIVSRLAYFALSRRREYLADATGAMLTRNPEGLAAALEKIQHDAPDDPKGSRTVSALYFANPYLRRHADNIWATHPPLEKRIAVLRGRA